MFCKHCGAQVPDDAKFCIHCGKQLEGSPAHIQVQGNSKECISPSDSATSSKEDDLSQTASQYQKTSQNTIPPEPEEDAPAAKSDYYASQFSKLRAGEKGNFNWAAFFLSIFHAAYRGPWRQWIRFMLVPLIVWVSAVILSYVGIANANLMLPLIGSVILFAACVLSLIFQIRYGFAFNQIYMTYLSQSPDSQNATPSAKKVWIVVAVLIGILLLNTVISAAVGQSMINSLSDSISEDLAPVESDPETATLPEDYSPPEEDLLEGELSTSDSGQESISRPATSSLEIIRYATENGRIQAVPPASQVEENLTGIGYTGYAVVTPLETDGFLSPKYGIYVTQLNVDIYGDPWIYSQTVSLYYSYTYDESGRPCDFQLQPDSIETSYSEWCEELTPEYYESMNRMDEDYYGDTPVPGVPWCDPESGEWYLDGEIYDGGGLYWS